MPTEKHNYKLLYSIMSQKMVNGTLKGIDWKRVATDLGAPTADAAEFRWYRFRKAQGWMTQGAKGVKVAKGTKDAKTEGEKKPVKGKGKGKGKEKKTSRHDDGEGEQRGENGFGDVKDEAVMSGGEDERMVDMKQEKQGYGGDDWDYISEEDV
jgi:hypothetical protein